MISKVVVMSGLPGTGKSTIAEAVGASLQAPVFSKDWLEAPILRSELVPRDQLGRLGYDLMTSLLGRQLAMRQSVVLDSVAGTESIRSEWRRITGEHDAEWYVIECVCSDPVMHRIRMNGRYRGIPGWPELTWDDVENIRRRFVRWSQPTLILDAIRPLEENLRRAIEFVTQ